MSDIRYISEDDPEGNWIEAQLTEEGVIVDKYDAEGENIGTWAHTYEELVG